MGLLAPPPAVTCGPLNAPHQEATVGWRLGDGTCQAGQAVFAATFTGGIAGPGGSGELLYRWQDPTRVAAFDVIALPKGTYHIANDACSLVYDSTNNKVYTLLGGPVDNGVNNVLCIASTDPVTLATTMLVDSLAVSTDANFENPNPAICTDGTYIYLLSCASSQNAAIFKLRCSDGGLDSSMRLPNGPGGIATTIGDVILLNGGSLYCAGNNFATTPGWAALVPTDLSTSTIIATGLHGTNDDYAVADGFLWLAEEASNHPGRLCKVALDLSSATLIDNGVPGWIDSVLYDGTNLWLSQVADPRAANIVVFDPVGLAVVEWFSLRPNEIHMNEMFLVQPTPAAAYTALWSASYNSTDGTIPSQIVLTPLNPDGTLTPRPVYGHGAM